MRLRNLQSLHYIKMNRQLSEISPPGWGHTKPDKKKGMKVGGTAAAMKKAKAQGRMPGVKNIFALMWSMKNQGDTPHYKPGKKGVLKKKYKKKKSKKKNEERELIFQANKQMAYVIAEGVMRSLAQFGIGLIPVVGDVAAAGMDYVGDKAEEFAAEKDKREAIRKARQEERKRNREERKRRRAEEREQRRRDNEALDREKEQRKERHQREIKDERERVARTRSVKDHTEFQYKNAYVQKLMETRR